MKKHPKTNFEILAESGFEVLLGASWVLLGRPWRAKKSLKIDKNRLKMRFRRQEASRRRFFTIFSIFGVVLEGPRPPKMEPKSLKNVKNRGKNDVKKNTFFKSQFLLILG